MTASRHQSWRTARVAMGWAMLTLFVGTVLLWTLFGFAPHLIESSPEPLAAFGRPLETWPILIAFLAGFGAAWALAPGVRVRGEEGEGGVGLSPLVAAALGPSAVIMAFAAYWPCSGDQSPVWASLRHSLEAFEGYVAEPFGVIRGCPAELPQSLTAAVLFAKITLALTIGLALAHVFRHTLDSLRARMAAQVVVFAGLDDETADAARAVRRTLTRREKLLLLDPGPEFPRARELAAEIGAIVLSVDVTDPEAVEVFMRSRGTKGIHGLYLMSPDGGANIRAMTSFLSWQLKLTEKGGDPSENTLSPSGQSDLGPPNSANHEKFAAVQRAELVVSGGTYDGRQETEERVARQSRLLEEHRHDEGRWQAAGQWSGVLPRRGSTSSEVPGHIVVRIDNPWHAEDWRQKQMTGRTGWLFDAVSVNEIAARHIVRQLKKDGIQRVVAVGDSPFELAVLSELAFERRVDAVLQRASGEGKERWAGTADFVTYQPCTPEAVLLGTGADQIAAHFQRQLSRYGIEDVDRCIRVVTCSVAEAMDEPGTKTALVLTDTSGHDPTFLAAQHPRWRIFEWASSVRGLTEEPLLGGLSIVGPTLEPVSEYGLDIWERLGRIQHLSYLYRWRGGRPLAGDPTRGDWDEDLNTFTRESNIRAFATFCGTVGPLGRAWATDLGAGGLESIHPLEGSELTVAAILEHESWVRHHVEYGWRLGDAAISDGMRARDKVRLHPDLVEWGALSADEQQKDVDSVLSTSALMRSLGFTLTDLPPARP